MNWGSYNGFFFGEIYREGNRVETRQSKVKGQEQIKCIIRIQHRRTRQIDIKLRFYSGIIYLCIMVH